MKLRIKRLVKQQHLLVASAESDSKMKKENFLFEKGNPKSRFISWSTIIHILKPHKFLFHMLSGLFKVKPMVSINPNSMSEKYCCMILRLNIDCNACCRKLRRVILRMKEVENHLIEKQQRRLCVCGRFVPSDLAIKIKKKMKRRVEILEVQEFGAENEYEQNTEKPPMVVEEKPSMVVYPGQVPVYPGQVPVYPGQVPAYPGQVPSMHSTMPMAY